MNKQSELAAAFSDILGSVDRINALVDKVNALEAEMEALKAQMRPDESGQPLTIAHSALVKQIGANLVKQGEATGALNPICRNGGKGPKKMYLLTEIKKFMSFYEKA